MWSEICIFIITRSGHFVHCELYADHSTVTSDESVCLHTDYTIMTGDLQCQLYKVATGHALPSYTRGYMAGRRPPRQIPTLATLGDRRDELAPLKSCKPKKRMSCKWYTDEIHLMRQLRRKNESIWRKSGLEVHRMIYINHRNEVNQAIRKAKCDYYITLLEKADVKVAFSTVNRLLASPSPQLPDQLGGGESLCEKFASFFTDKIDRIRAAVDSVPVTNFDLSHDTDLEQLTTTTLDYFKEMSETEVGKIIKSSKSTTCSLDPLPTEIIKKTSSAHIPAHQSII